MIVSRWTFRTAAALALLVGAAALAGCASTAPVSAFAPAGSDSTFELPTIAAASATLEPAAPTLVLPSFRLDPRFEAESDAAPEATEPARAEEAPAEGEKKEEGPPETRRWALYIEFAADASGGNSVSRGFDGRFDIKRVWTRDDIAIFGRAEYRESENDDGDVERNKSRLTGGVQYNRKLDEDGSFYGFVRQDFERDPFNDIKFRSQSWVGVGETLFKNEKHEVKGEIAPGYVATDYFNDQNVSAWSARAFEGWEWKVFENWTFVEGFEFISNLEEIDDDFRTTFNADLRTQLTESIFVSFGFEHRYDSEPGRDDNGDRLKRQDYSVTVKLGLAF